jgi:hypothetical protein
VVLEELVVLQDQIIQEMVVMVEVIITQREQEVLELLW